MSVYTYPITVTFEHQIRFTHDAFSLDNIIIANILGGQEKAKGCVLVFIEESVASLHAGLVEKVRIYLAKNCPQCVYKGVHVLEGGETSKNNLEQQQEVLHYLQKSGIDRHSYVMAVGGGAFLDLIGFAAAITHRGLRLLRFPTTSLSQDDSAVGVKNSINAFGQKNFLGTFAVPFAVIVDFDFLATQPLRERILGLVEAIKVSLVKDADFFAWILQHEELIAAGDQKVIETIIERSAILHAEHIAQHGDPFEQGSSRPLDFGHWAAHKLEVLSHFSLSHAEAVSLGISLDVVYSTLCGLLDPEYSMAILDLLDSLGMPTWTLFFQEIEMNGRLALLQGLEEFREHLGGELTLLLLEAPGFTVEVHKMDSEIIQEALGFLRQRHCLACG